MVAETSTPDPLPKLDAGSSLHAQTVCAAFQIAIDRYADRVALRTRGGETVITWAQYGERVRRLTAGLAALGLARHETLAIQLTNRPEFHLVDMAAVHLGAIPFSVYNTSSPEQIQQRLETADSRIMVTERAFLVTVREAARRYGRLEHLIVVDDVDEDGRTLESVEASGAPDFDFDGVWQAVAPTDVVTLIYTSGTTGPPKAAQLSHGGPVVPEV